MPMSLYLFWRDGQPMPLAFWVAVSVLLFAALIAVPAALYRLADRETAGLRDAIAPDSPDCREW